MQSDLEGTIVEFERVLARHQMRMEAAEILGTSSTEDLLSMSPDSVRVLLGLSFSPATADPQMVTLSSMIAANQLSALSNPELRTRLARWNSMFMDYDETQTNLLRRLLEQYAPSFSSFVLVPGVPVDVARSAMNYDALFSDLQFQNEAIIVMMSSRGASRELRELLAFTRELVELVRRELNQAA